MRYLKVTLLVGLTASLIVVALAEIGAFRAIDVALHDFIDRGSVMPEQIWIQHVVAILFAFAVAWTTIDITRRSLKVVIACGALFEMLSASWVLNLYGHYFSPFPGSLAIILSFIGGFIYSRSEAGRRKRILRQMLGERLSTKSFYSLVNSNVPLNFSGEMRDATVLICEVFNHEELMDVLPVPDYVAMSNTFLRTASEYLVQQGGYLDECDGESLRVIFGAPVPDRRHATQACEAALQLAQRLENLNLECEARWHKTLDFRIGINSGELITAAYGSHRLGSFSVAGEPVEHGRRLCAVNTIYGSKILIGSGTFEAACEDIEVRPIELLRGHESRAREEVYELLALKNGLSPEEARRRDLFWKGVVYYRERRWDEALEHFQSALGLNALDGPLQFYIRRTEQVRDGMPALGWTGADF